MKFRIVVDVECSKQGGGKFASKDTVQQEIIEAVDNANPGDITIEDATYSVDEWSVSAEEVK